MKIKIKKLHPDAVIPQYAKPGDAGMDLTATSINATDKYVEYGTGLAFELPPNHVGLLFPRSSISKMDLSLCNAVGVLDSQYSGEVKLRFRNLDDMFPEDAKIYKIGDRIGQLMIIPYPQIEFEEVEELSDTERSDGGFGSSGD